MHFAASSVELRVYNHALKLCVELDWRVAREDATREVVSQFAEDSVWLMHLTATPSHTATCSATGLI